MSKKPLNLTLNKTVLSAADRLLEGRGYSSFSVLVEELVRNEYKRVFGTDELKETPPPYKSTAKENAAASEAEQLFEKADAAATSTSPHPSPEAPQSPSEPGAASSGKRRRRVSKKKP